ncbi:MAG: hypothetical protein HWQ38_27145 [Nostoc sp. NMS7]|uniref:hypothetical protein n=1 Tax=Nostoc sp. NMS7 TaxID=2815391 RepID=UPI00260086B5|nr:hypothetical protein [Nostoc sp. NMS7]MBN3949949.1 hypothetical protein [Nostoc sp. NMS7]
MRSLLRDRTPQNVSHGYKNLRSSAMFVKVPIASAGIWIKAIPRHSIAHISLKTIECQASPNPSLNFSQLLKYHVEYYFLSKHRPIPHLTFLYPQRDRS